MKTILFLGFEIFMSEISLDIQREKHYWFILFSVSWALVTSTEKKFQRQKKINDSNFKVVNFLFFKIMCTVILEHVLFKVNIKTILFLWFDIFLSEISENIEQKTFWWNIKETNIFEYRIIHTDLLSTINPWSFNKK